MKDKILQIFVFGVMVVLLLLLADYLHRFDVEPKMQQDSVVAQDTEAPTPSQDKIVKFDEGRYILRNNMIVGPNMVVTDPSTLVYVKNGYFKDAINVYSVEGVPGVILDGVNPDTFQVMSDDYGYLGMWHYTLENNVIKYINIPGYTADYTRTALDADPTRFRVFVGAYMTDDTAFFFKDHKLFADKDSFEVLRLKSDNKTHTSYAKDKYHVFHAGEILNDADSETFEVDTFGQFIVGKDATQVFVEERLLDGLSSKDVKLEKGEKMGYVLSDNDTNWYYWGHCHGGGFISEQDFFQDQYKDWDKIKYLEEYVYC